MTAPLDVVARYRALHERAHPDYGAASVDATVLLALAREIREECAIVCEELIEVPNDDGTHVALYRNYGNKTCAKAIRALNTNAAAQAPPLAPITEALRSDESRVAQKAVSLERAGHLGSQDHRADVQPAAAASATPLTDALFSKHQAECASVDFEALGKAGINQLAVRQVRELLEHARRLEVTLRMAVEALEQFAKFAEKWDAKPIWGLAKNPLYTIHAASINLDDCYAARAALAAFRALEKENER